MEGIRTYLINLDKDTLRLAAMDEQLGRLGLSYDRIAAVYGTAMPDWLEPYFLRSDGSIASRMRSGEVGCYASHLIAMKRIANSSVPALVLEDDVELSDDIAELLAAIRSFPEGWDIMRLSSPYKRRFFPVSPITSRDQDMKFSRVPLSAGAYLLTPAGAHKFLNWKRLRTLPLDQDLRRAWDHELATYGVYPRPVWHGPSVSTIDGISPRKARLLAGDLPYRLKDGIRRLVFDLRWLGPANWIVSFVRPKKA